MGWWSCIINGGKCTDTACDKTIADVQSCKKSLDDANEAKDAIEEQLLIVKTERDQLQHNIETLNDRLDTLTRERNEAIAKLNNKETFTCGTNYGYWIAVIIVIFMIAGLWLFCSWRWVKMTNNYTIEKARNDIRVDEKEVKDNQ